MYNEEKERQKKQKYTLKRLKVVNEPHQPASYVPHPIKLPENVGKIPKSAEFDQNSELYNIYSRIKERAKMRKNEEPLSSPPVAVPAAPRTVAAAPADGADGPVDEGFKFKKKTYIPTYYKQTWKATVGGFKPKSAVSVV